MTLPDLLQELSVLLPERVRMWEDEAPGYALVTAYAERQWQTIFELAPAHGYASMHPFSDQILEAALREECATRGWYISLSSQPGPGETEWDVEISGIQKAFTASTPAEALAAAVLVSALAAVSKSAPKLK